MIFEEKYISSYILLTNQILLIICLPLLREILGNMCIVIVCEPGCDVVNFEVTLTFLIKQIFLRDQKVKTKINILRTKKAFKTK